ncbi:MAG TPA: ABC transporter substrate-binding protein [Ktedonobacterales bacterium]|nr:ABC transporter substrate-binding protein [Ktedonobacterales bacterium]
MPIFDRQQRTGLNQLEEAYQQDKLSRRQFMQRATALGLSVSAASAFLAACGGSSASNTVDLVTTWGGTEQDSFRAVVAPFTQQHGIKVNIESTRDLDTLLTTRIQANNPPDLAILPNPAKMQQLAGQNHLIALDKFLSSSSLQQDYAQSWISLGSVNSNLYSIFYKAANKATVWYSPQQFQSNNYQVPKTWDDLIALSGQIAGSGKFPWAMGVSSGAASGWPATDWVAEIFINESGPDMYDKWITHKIPWTDASIKSAFQKFGAIAGGQHYINGAPQSILATDDQTASYGPFNSPPTSYMYYLGDFTEGFITAKFPSLQAGTGFSYFDFPTITASNQGAITCGADLVAMLKDTSSTRTLVNYLVTADAQAIWVKRGGFTSVNKSVALNDYPNKVAQNSAQALTGAPIVRYGAGDMMPPALQTAWWKGMLTFIGDQSQLDGVLSNLESTAQQAYQS